MVAAYCRKNLDRPDRALEAILDAAIDLTRADRGTIQLLEPSGALVIRTQRGFDEEFLTFFAEVRDEMSVCGAAARTGEPVVIEDVTRDDRFSETAALGVMRRAGCLALQLMPLINSAGETVGMISTHFGRPHRPTDAELAALKLLAGIAADYLEHTSTRERARLAQQRTVTRLRLALGAAHVAAWQSDQASGQVYGPEFNEILGFPGDRALTADEIRSRYLPGELERIRGITYAAFDRGEREVEVEARFRRLDGEVRWLLLRGELTRNDDGQPRGLVGVAMDITERKETEERMASDQDALAAQLRAMQRLQEISTQLVGEEKVDGLYQRIMEAAASIMHSDSASLQAFNPERDQLLLVSSTGFTEEAKRHWKWVTRETRTACGEALRTRRRVIEDDVENSSIIVGPDRDMHLKNGIHAAQTTPLVSRTGQLVGMISTHWSQRHHPQEQDLALIDVLARQAADLIERSLTEEHTRLLVREVSHRAKNLLAVVQAIVQQTKNDSTIWADALTARLTALAASQDLIVRGDWHGVELDALIRSQLQHLSSFIGTRITLEGPAVRVAPSAAQTLGMAFCELATNAVKYGSLSNRSGTVSIEWSVTAGSEPEFGLVWQERNGPAVELPRRNGFGTDVTVQMVEHALDANVRIQYDPSGVSWRVRAPAAAVLAANHGEP
jgi:PAS domain S-box-containing protein